MEKGGTYQFPRDAMVEIFDGSLVSVGGERTVGCPIDAGVKELDCVCYPCLSGCHPCIRDAKERDVHVGIPQAAAVNEPRTPSR